MGLAELVTRVFWTTVGIAIYDRLLKPWLESKFGKKGE